MNWNFLRGGKIVLPALKKHGKLADILEDSLLYVVGSLIYSLSVTIFTAPNNIAPGGVTGIATILHYLFHFHLGVTMLVLNIPLFLMSLRHLGAGFIIRTAICTVLVSVMTDTITFFPQYHGSMLLAALYGGVLAGIGLGLVFLRGATTGGTDIASRLLRIRFRHISMGRMMMGVDFVIIVISALVFRSIDSALYAIITIFATSRIIDSILYGSDNGRMVLVVSDKNDEIARTITQEINRGVTLLKGRGFYTGRERDVLMCAVRRPETARLRTIVRLADPSAFIIMCEAGEVIGEGFKPITKED